jgi:hypothetical protein
MGLWMMYCLCVDAQLGEKESSEAAVKKHLADVRQIVNVKLAECQEYEGIVAKLQRTQQEQEGKAGHAHPSLASHLQCASKQKVSAWAQGP